MPYNIGPSPLELMTQRAERAEQALRDIEHERIQREVHDRTARAEAMAVVRERERAAAHTAEIEEARKGAWLLYLTAPERIVPVAQAQFDPNYISSRTPPDPAAWPPGDCLQNHLNEFRYAPGAASIDDGDVPSLVQQAMAAGIPV